MGEGDARAVLRETSAQGTVEYALTMATLLAFSAACAALWRAGQEGVLARLVEAAASHVFAGTGMLDIALF